MVTPVKTKTLPPKVNSIAKCLRILESFTPQQPELNLTQLSRLLKMPKSTLLNMILTLEDVGYLYKAVNSQNYRLGYKLMELSYNARTSLSIVQYAMPFMEELQNHTGEIVYLTTHINGRVFYMECLYPIKRAVTYSTNGKTLPMHCTGCGKAMLAFMSEPEVDDIIARWGLTRITADTITDAGELKKALAKYRRLGYAIDNGEEGHNVRCIAMPIRSAGGLVAGALSISGPVLTMTDDKFPEYARLLAGACNFLSQYAHLFPAIQLQEMVNRYSK
jgi:DNA-binding IclR family transcriptional regulator